MMLSKGIKELIKTPYFFLHEYKREKKYSDDTIRQILGGILLLFCANSTKLFWSV